MCQGRRKTRPSGSGSKFLTAAWRGETSGSRSGRVLAGFLAVFEAIAVAVQLEDVDVMGQPVEQRAAARSLHPSTYTLRRTAA